jgi:hypothetical protein
LNEKNLKSNGSNKYNYINLVSAILGFLGAINSVTIGFYLLSTIFNPILSGLLIQGYILSPTMAVITAMLIYGSFLISKNENTKKGAKINLIAGLSLAFVYIYYAHFSEPQFLSWLSPAGILLIIPPTLSGIIGKMTLS